MIISKLKILISAVVLLGVSPVSHALTQEECKPQAETAYTLLGSIEKGIYPATQEHEDKIKKAIEHIEKGDYCSARSILMFLNKQ